MRSILKFSVTVALVLLVVFGGAPRVQAQDDPCLVEKYEVSTNDGTTTSMVGNYKSIDKILSIEVFAGTYFTNFVITKIKVTYRSKGSDRSEKTVEFGSGGSSQGKYEFPQGIYLTKMTTWSGKYMDAFQLCRSDGDCSKKFGNDRYTDGRRNFEVPRGTIVSVS
jgi:hypothetical protein